MNDPLFTAAWPQATETRRLADRKRSDAVAARARSGELGTFAKVFQLEMDGHWKFLQSVTSRHDVRFTPLTRSKARRS